MMAFTPLLRGWFNTLTATRIVSARLWLRRSIVWTVVAAFLVLTILAGVAFIAAGSFLSLRDAYSPWVAGLIVGGTLLLIALIGALVSWIIYNRRPVLDPPLHASPMSAAAASATAAAVDSSVPPPPTPDMVRPDMAEPGVSALLQLGEQLGDTIRGIGIRKKDIMIGALVAGVVLGGSPDLRRRVLKVPRRRDQYEQPPRARHRSSARRY